MATMYKIFLSSTSCDLEAYREAAHRAIDGLPNFTLVKMEDFGARDDNARALCERLVQDCDLLVGLMGHYYGSSPPGETISFTELEYRAATRAGLSRLMFVAPDDFPIPARLRESDASFERQRRFRQEVMAEHVVAAFEGPEQLASAITKALYVWKEGRGQAPPGITADGNPTTVAPPVPASHANSSSASAITVAKIRGEQISAWIDEMLSAQDLDSGGIRTHTHDPASPTQVWSTAQCLTGILRTFLAADYRNQFDDALDAHHSQISKAFRFIEDHRFAGTVNGWGYNLGVQTEALTEITCWVTLARLYGLRMGVLWPEQKGLEVLDIVQDDLRHILSRQYESGGWCPVPHLSQKNTRTYSTVMALWTLLEALRTPGVVADPAVGSAVYNGFTWLLSERSEKFGWIPNPARRQQRDEFFGLEAHVLTILLFARETLTGPARQLFRNPVVEKIKERFIDHEDLRTRRIMLNNTIDSSDQWLQNTDVLLEGSSFLWAPWSSLALDWIWRDETLSSEKKKAIRLLQDDLIARIFEAREELGFAGVYEIAETVLCLSAIFWRDR